MLRDSSIRHCCQQERKLTANCKLANHIHHKITLRSTGLICFISSKGPINDNHARNEVSTTNKGLFDHSSIILVFLFSYFFLKLFWRTHFSPFIWNTDTRPLKDKAHTLGILRGKKNLKAHFAGDKLLGTFFFFNRIKGTLALLRQQQCFKLKSKKAHKHTGHVSVRQRVIQKRNKFKSRFIFEFLLHWRKMTTEKCLADFYDPTASDIKKCLIGKKTEMGLQSWPQPWLSTCMKTVESQRLLRLKAANSRAAVRQIWRD